VSAAAFTTLTTSSYSPSSSLPPYPALRNCVNERRKKTGKHPPRNMDPDPSPNPIVERQDKDDRHGKVATSAAMEKTMELGRAMTGTRMAMDTKRLMDLSRIVEMEHKESWSRISPSTGTAVKRTMELSVIMMDTSQTRDVSQPTDQKRNGNENIAKRRTRNTATGPYKSIMMAPNRNMTTDRTMDLNEAISTSQNIGSRQISNRGQNMDENFDRNRSINMGPNKMSVMDRNMYPPLISPTEMTRDSNPSMNGSTDQDSLPYINTSGSKKATANNYPSQGRTGITKSSIIAKKSTNMARDSIMRISMNTSINTYNSMNPSNAISRSTNSYSTVESNLSTYNTMPTNMNATTNNNNNNNTNNNAMKTNTTYNATPAHHPMCPHNAMSTNVNMSMKGNPAMSTARKLVEEQAILVSVQKRYYPVKLGDLYNQRYRVIAKLGFGQTSTVWLARDEMWVGPASQCYMSNDSLAVRRNTSPSRSVFKMNRQGHRPLMKSTCYNGSSLLRKETIIRASFSRVFL
jgi:hypothetical protein